MLRVNLSVAILAMVNRTALAHEIISRNDSSSYSQCPASNMAEERHRDGPFVWDQKTRGIILGAFFYGYVITELPGGWLAYRFGAKWVLGMGILWTSMFTLLTPLTVYLDMRVLLVLRVLEGLGEGVSFPCFHALYAQWVPPSERSRIPAINFSGLGVGTVIAFPFSAALCDTEIGWPLVFYVFGAIGVLWSIIWLIFGSSSPATSKWISEEERLFLKTALEETVNNEENQSCSTVPWLDILKTPAIWAIWLTHAASLWGWHTLSTQLPAFFNDVLRLGISKNGVMAAIPYICFAIIAISSGFVADYVLKRKLIPVVVVRKIAKTLCLILPGLFLLLTTLVGCDVKLAIFLMSLAVGCEGFAGVGGLANNLDVAGRYAGITYGVANTLGGLCGIVAPYVAEAVTQDSYSMDRWRIVFGIVAGIYWAAALFYLIFAQGHTAKWAVVEKKPAVYVINDIENNIQLKNC